MENPFAKGVFPEVKQLIASRYRQEKNEDIAEAKIGEMIKAEFDDYLSIEPYRAYDWDFIISRVISKLDIGLEIDVAALVEKYCRQPYIKAYPDGRKILKWLERRDHTLLVITNGFYKYQYPVLQALHLEKYFSRIITTDISQAAKPDPASFMLPEEDFTTWIHVGDSLIMDVYGANNAGGVSVYINRDLPEELTEVDLSKRMEDERVISFIQTNLDQELAGHARPYQENLIYPDFILQSLQELKKIILVKEVEQQL